MLGKKRSWNILTYSVFRESMARYVYKFRFAWPSNERWVTRAVVPVKYGRSYRHVSNYWAVSPLWRIHRAWLKARTTFSFCPTLLTIVVGFRLPAAQYLLTYYLLTPCSRVLLQKLTGFQLVKKFPAFYGTQKFITAFTSARHLSLSWARSIQSIPSHSNSWRSILILSSLIRLGFPSGLFPSGFPTKTLHTSLLSPVPVTCRAHLILFNLTTRTIMSEENKSWSSSLYIFLHSSVDSSHLGPNILLSTLLSNTLNLRSKFHTHSKQSAQYRGTNICYDITNEQTNPPCSHQLFNRIGNNIPTWSWQYLLNIVSSFICTFIECFDKNLDQSSPVA